MKSRKFLFKKSSFFYRILSKSLEKITAECDVNVRFIGLRFKEILFFYFYYFYYFFLHYLSPFHLPQHYVKEITKSASMKILETKKKQNPISTNLYVCITIHP